MTSPLGNLMTPDPLPSPDAEPVPITISWTGMTHKGRVRANNEDAFLAVTFDGNELRYLGKSGDAPLTHSDFLFAVSDGMGGANAGEFASKIAVERLSHLLPRAFRSAAAGISTGFRDVFEDLFAEIDRAMKQMSRSYEECAGMGATLSMAWICPGWLYFAHIGDSRIYYLPHTGGIKQISHDHTLPGRLVREGKLSDREARVHPRKNVLEQVLGAGRQPLDIQLGAVGYEPGDRFLICSDGVVDGLRDFGIEELLRRPRAIRAQQNPARRLIDEGILTSGRDNLTAVVVEIQRTPPQ